MKRTMTRLLGCLALLVLVGCASGPKFAEIQASLPALTAEQGRIWFYRDASGFGAVLQPPIRLNGELVGDSVPGGFFYRDVAPGNYTIATTTEVERQLTMTVAAGEQRYVRTYPGFGFLVGRVHPELVDPALGKAQVETLSYTGAPKK